MTKEKLYELLLQESRYSSIEYLHFVKKYMDEFFESNAVTPKGTNRHPYADVLHEYIEGVEIQCKENGSGWYNLCHFPFQSEYRIKPQEPVYEYKYSIVLAGKQYISEEYKTIEEIKDFNNTYLPVAIEDTKRVRQ